MALKGVNQGLAGFAQFGQQQLKNKGQRILNENAQMDLNVKQANQSIALMETSGLVKFNPNSNRYEISEDYLTNYNKIPESERGGILNGDSLFPAYTDRDGKKKMGELGAAITVADKVPTSMKDENGNPTEEGKKFLADEKKGIIIPTRKEAAPPPGGSPTGARTPRPRRRRRRRTPPASSRWGRGAGGTAAGSSPPPPRRARRRPARSSPSAATRAGGRGGTPGSAR